MKKREKRISSRSLYTILSIFVIILAGVVVSSVWSNPAVSHDSINVKVTIGGVDYSLQEAINLNKMGVDWSQSISSILAQDLTISGNAVFNNAVEFTGGLWSEAGTLSAYEISADNYMSSPKIVSNEFCVGPDYATADCITEWPAGGTATLPSEASFLGLTLGDGSAVDTLMTFDGNIDDFYIANEYVYDPWLQFGSGLTVGGDTLFALSGGDTGSVVTSSGAIANGRVYCNSGFEIVGDTRFYCHEPFVHYVNGGVEGDFHLDFTEDISSYEIACLALGGTYGTGVTSTSSPGIVAKWNINNNWETDVSEPAYVEILPCNTNI